MNFDFNPYSEQNISQAPALEVLRDLGYAYISPEQALAQRGSRVSVILKDILRAKLVELNNYEYLGRNHKFSEKTIQKAVEDIDVALSEGLVRTNEKIFDLMNLGKSYQESLFDGNHSSFNIKYIDWENPYNNVFHVSDEFSVERFTVKDNARPDIVLFVNGIPFAVIECKKASISMAQGIEQMIRNQGKEYIPQLFKFTQILMSSNKNETMYATCGTGKKFWCVWQEEDIEWLNEKSNSIIKDRLPTKQDKDIISLLEPARLLDITRFFTLFDKDEKKICRYQQYFAIKEMLKTVETFDGEGNRQSGVIWHTQGSGKSITMVMFARFMLHKLKNSDPKVIVVTDRIDLDKQIRNTFVHSRIKTARANSGDHLTRLIADNNATVVTTLVHKFKTVAKTSAPNLSKNIFVLVDESHRSEYGEMYLQMKKIFPNACYLGFTGTPLMKKDKNTMIKFGRLIHKYTISDGVRDKSIVPLLYDGRMIDQKVNRQAIDMQLDIITRHLSENQKNEVQKKWANFEKIASSEQRIKLVAFDINQHFLKEYKTKGAQFTGMLAVQSKKDAVKYLEAFEELGDLNAAVIISAPDMREGSEEVDDDPRDPVRRFWNKMMRKYGDESKYEESIKSEFLHGDDVDLLIVVDKLLTGFNAPRASVLYIDKSMKEHTLLQAIARVNRLYEGKDFGLIVDYRGLFDKLDEALGIYSGEGGLDSFDPDDLKGAVYDVISIIGSLRQSYSDLSDMFIGITNKSDMESYEVILSDEDLRNKFYESLSSLGRFLKFALSSENVYKALGESEIEKYKRAFKFYTEIRQAVMLRYSDSIDHKEYEQKMQKLMDNYIAAQGVIHITAPVNILDRDAFEEELDRLGSSKAKADAIQTRMTKHISEHYSENPAYYKRFSERIEEIIAAYREKRLSELDLLTKMRKTMDDLRNGADNIECPVVLKNNAHARAFYGVIQDIVNPNAEYLDAKAKAASPEAKYSKDNEMILAALSLNIDSIIDRLTKVDWHNNTDVHNKISQEIDDLLYTYEKNNDLILSPRKVEKLINEIIKVALSRY
jgi:type I restriction enzyme R subunit